MTRVSKGKFSSTGVVVGQVDKSTHHYQQKINALKGNKVTMGHSAPSQSEGAVGDITVRDISVLGLVCYIKTNSGWFDINSLTNAGVLDWKNVAYNATYNWVDYDSSNPVMYAKDSNGFVHLRGWAKTASTGDVGSGKYIFGLPAGFRPIQTFFFRTLTGSLAFGNSAVVRVYGDLGGSNVGLVDAMGNSSTSESAARVVFDGISFFANPAIVSSGGGSSATTGSGGSGGGSGGGGGGGGGGGF